MAKPRKDEQGWGAGEPSVPEGVDVVTGEVLPSSVMETFNPHDVMDLQHFRITPLGMIVTGKPEFDDWKGIGYWLHIMIKGIQFNVGDWIAFGEGAWGDRVAQVIDAGRWKYETVRSMVWVSTKVPLTVRRAELDWSHHQKIAHLNVEGQKLWLARAVEHSWTCAQLEAALKAHEAGLPENGGVKYWIEVKCESEKDQQECARQLTNLERHFALKSK